MIIEDKVFPKRNSLDGSASQDLDDPLVFAQKIRAGREMVISDDFMVIARLESLIAGAGLEDALERAEQYIQAGADGLMVHSSDRRPDDILTFAEVYEALCRHMGCRSVLVSVPTTYNTVSDAELVACGFNVIIHANHLLRAAYKSMNQAARTIPRAQLGGGPVVRPGRRDICHGGLRPHLPQRQGAGRGHASGGEPKKRSSPGAGIPAVEAVPG